MELERFLKQYLTLCHPETWPGDWRRGIRVAFFNDTQRGDVGVVHLALTIIDKSDGMEIEVVNIILTIVSSN